MDPRPVRRSRHALGKPNWLGWVDLFGFEVQTEVPLQFSIPTAQRCKAWFPSASLKGESWVGWIVDHSMNLEIHGGPLRLQRVYRVAVLQRRPCSFVEQRSPAAGLHRRLPAPSRSQTPSWYRSALRGKLSSTQRSDWVYTGMQLHSSDYPETLSPGHPTTLSKPSFSARFAQVGNEILREVLHCHKIPAEVEESSVLLFRPGRQTVQCVLVFVWASFLLETLQLNLFSNTSFG